MANTAPVVLITGLDGAGKTKMLYTLKLGEVTEQSYREVKFEPTVGFNFEVVPWLYKKVRFQFKVWDLSGNKHVRGMWRYFYEATPPDVVIYVVEDSEAGRARLEEAKDSFQQILHSPSLNHTLKLVIVNMRDENSPVSSNRVDVEKRVADGLGINGSDGSMVRVFAVHLGKSIDEDMNLFNAMNYVANHCRAGMGKE